MDERREPFGHFGNFNRVLGRNFIHSRSGDCHAQNSQLAAQTQKLFGALVRGAARQKDGHRCPGIQFRLWAMEKLLRFKTIGR